MKYTEMNELKEEHYKSNDTFELLYKFGDLEIEYKVLICGLNKDLYDSFKYFVEYVLEKNEIDLKSLSDKEREKFITGVKKEYDEVNNINYEIEHIIGDLFKRTNGNGNCKLIKRRDEFGYDVIKKRLNTSLEDCIKIEKDRFFEKFGKLEVENCEL